MVQGWQGEAGSNFCLALWAFLMLIDLVVLDT